MRPFDRTLLLWPEIYYDDEDDDDDDDDRYASFQGNHLANATCLTHDLFKHVEIGGKVRWPLTRRKTHETHKAVIDE